MVPCCLWLWDVWWEAGENVPSNDQTVYFWRETNMKCYSLMPLVFLSRNHLDSEGSHKHHSGSLNLRFPIVYGCALGSQTSTRLYFWVSFWMVSHKQQISARTQVLELYSSRLWMALILRFTNTLTHFPYRRVTLGRRWLWGNKDTRMSCRVSIFYE